MDASEWRGELRWAVKASFVSYVRANQGSVDLLGDAREEAGEYVFPRAEDGLQIDEHSPRGTAKFSGGLRFTAHGGRLDLTINEPRIVFGPNRGTFVATDEHGEEIELATLDVGGPLERDGVLEWIGVTPTLTSEGASAFRNVYPTYSELDSVSFELVR